MEAEFQSKEREIMLAGADNAYTLKGAGGA